MKCNLMKFEVMLLIVISLLGAQKVAASLYVEPYVGYAVGTIDGNVGSSKVDVQTTSTIYGAKLGAGYLGTIAVGGEFMGMNSDDDDKTSANDDGSSDSTFTGIFAQFTFPILLKVSGSYFFSAKYDNTDNVDIEGTATKLGVGFTGLPFIAINLDIINATYDEGTSAGNNATVDVDQTSTILSVSLPLSI